MTNILNVRLKFARALNVMASEVHTLATEKGWWDRPRSIKGLLALIASECIGEAVEAIRKPGPSDKIGNFLNVEEELSDAIIRTLDMAVHLEIDIGSWVAFEYGQGFTIQDFQARVHEDKSDLADFADIYSCFVSTIDLWSYISDDFAIQHIGKIDDLDMLGELLPRLANCRAAIPYVEQEGSMLFEASLRLLMLRLMAMGQYRNWWIGKAIMAKHEYNKTRPERHGGKVY